MKEISPQKSYSWIHHKIKGFSFHSEPISTKFIPSGIPSASCTRVAEVAGNYIAGVHSISIY